MLAIRVVAASARANLLGGGCSKELNWLSGASSLKTTSTTLYRDAIMSHCTLQRACRGVTP